LGRCRRDAATVRWRRSAGIANQRLRKRRPARRSRPTLDLRGARCRRTLTGPIRSHSSGGRQRVGRLGRFPWWRTPAAPA
jgi:hypothetical protein